MALNNVQRIGAKASSAKIRCSFTSWSGPAALLCGRDLMIFKISSGLVHSGSVLGMEERALYMSGNRCSVLGGGVLRLSK